MVFYFSTRISREREQLATHDTLTGLPNRMLFKDRLEQSLIRAKRHRTLVGVLKIDRYFVKDLPNAPASEALIGSILALCQGLDLGAVAEGVETRAQLEALRALGCRTVQGYFISRPVPAGQILALLGRDWLAPFGTSQAPSAS